MSNPTGKTGTKPTNKELAERIDFTWQLYMEQGQTKGQVKAALKDKYGVCARTCENYLAEVRDRHHKQQNTSVEEQRSTALMNYERILEDPTAKHSDRIQAQTRIDKLLGLEARQQVEMTHKGTGIIVKEVIHKAGEPAPGTDDG